MAQAFTVRAFGAENCRRQTEMISTLTGWQKTVAPLQGANERSLRSGGLRYAPTTGYYLTAFQAEDALASFHTIAEARIAKKRSTNSHENSTKKA
jgi:hypothetical protein